MIGLALPFAVFVSTVLLVLGIYSIVQDLVEKTAASGNSSHKIPAAKAMPMDATLDIATKSLPSRSQSPDSVGEKFNLWVEQSGMRVSPASLVMLSLAIGLVAFVMVAAMLFNVWLALLALAITTPLPLAMVALERYRRTDRIRSQLPDALDLMSRMLRAGQTIPQALSGVADEFDAPIADEFGYCYEQQNLGLSTEASMYEMARRTGVLELRILVVALTIHRQTGGNLSELLDNLAHVIRERYRIQGQIKSLTADGRMQAAILLALPPILLAVLSFLNAEYVTILYQFPWLLIGMFAFELLGAIWLHRIVSFDF